MAYKKIDYIQENKRLWFHKGAFLRKIKVNRKYKDRLFRHLFMDKKDLLDLYNSLADKDYTNTDEMTIITLKDAIFMKMKNDISFIVGNTLNLYEHQSTINPNMPVRGFIYFAQQYDGLIASRNDNIYGNKLIKLPTPQFIVFYNGAEEMDDEVTLYMSDSYADGRGSGCIECTCRVLNINRGHNASILNKCRKLWEYSEFVSEIRAWTDKGYDIKAAVLNSMDYCIENDILKDFLIKEKAEVLNMLLTEYDEKKHMRLEREYGIEMGIEQERANTERERSAKEREQLAKEREKKRADYAEQRVIQLEAELRLLKEQIKK